MSEVAHLIPDLAHIGGVERVPAKRLIPVSGAMQSLFVDGAIRRGSTVTVVGSVSVALGLVAKATQEGMWCAGVGLNELGVVAAADIGIDLERFPLIPNPGNDWATVVAALIDGFDLVLMQTNKSLNASVTRKLEARLRQKGGVIVLVAPMPNVWSQTDFVIRQVEVKCRGLSNGHGNLTGQEFSVIMEGRGAAARPRQAELTLS